MSHSGDLYRPNWPHSALLRRPLPPLLRKPPSVPPHPPLVQHPPASHTPSPQSNFGAFPAACDPYLMPGYSVCRAGQCGAEAALCLSHTLSWTTAARSVNSPLLAAMAAWSEPSLTTCSFSVFLRTFSHERKATLGSSGWFSLPSDPRSYSISGDKPYREIRFCGPLLHRAVAGIRGAWRRDRQSDNPSSIALELLAQVVLRES